MDFETDSINNEVWNNMLFRYGQIYGSRYPMRTTTEAILRKIALANRTRKPPKVIDVVRDMNAMGIWRRYVHLFTSRFHRGPSLPRNVDIAKVDKMLNYGRYFDAT